ncbi:pilus assembly protein TadG-related protein [Altererythrobacter sp. Z27]|uniref:pilus assembly protein TadG-related protein n=1 Tax=Altererythrobacter sp. Z27 TaxID=3461147 RepID=UPI004043CB14
MTTQANYRKILRDQEGAVAATYALSLVALIAILGLAFDYARMVSMDTELQNAADQAALAGATQLDRSSGSMERAIAAAQGGLVANSTLISDDGEGTTIDVTDATQVVFYSNRADAEAGTNSFTDTSRFAEAGFVQVTVDTRDVNYAFTPIVGLFSEDMSASAVAGMGSALCRIPPLMICNPDEGSSSSTPPKLNVAARRGHGLLAKPGGGSGGWSPGNYGYLDIGPNGATGVRQALGWDGPPGNCVDVSGTDALEPVEVDTQTGNIASGPQAINTRFDVYSSQGCVGSGTCSPAYNVRKDLMRAVDATPSSGNSCDIHNSGWKEPANAYHPTDGAADFLGAIQSMGHPRDKCHAVEDGAPNNCRTSAFGNGNWDRNAYFRTHYVRSAATGNGGIGSSWSETDWKREMTDALLDTDNDGVIDHGVAQLTRYEVYMWETTKAAANAVVDGVQILADTPAGASGSALTTRNRAVCGPVIYPPPTAAPPDRRVMSVAVVNCQAQADNLNGKGKDVLIAHFIDAFVVQPSYDRGQAGKVTKKDEIYLEIIRETDIIGTGAISGPTLRRDVPYLVR